MMINLRKKKLIFGILVIFLCLTFSFRQVAFASGRSAAGGGEMAEMNWGAWAASQAISIGLYFVSSAVVSGLDTLSATGSFSTGFDAAFTTNGLAQISIIPNQLAVPTFTGLLANYTVLNTVGLATSQLGSALMNSGMDPRAAIFASALFGGIITGGLNPGAMLGTGFIGAVEGGLYSATGILNGMALGAVQGAIEGAILAGLANDKGQLPFWAGPLANLAGGFATNFIVGGFGVGANARVNAGQEFYASNLGLFNPGDGFSSAMSHLVQSLPATAWQIGVNAVVQDMDPGERMIWSAVGNGLTPLVGKLGNMAMSELGITGAANAASGVAAAAINLPFAAASNLLSVGPASSSDTGWASGSVEDRMANVGVMLTDD